MSEDIKHSVDTNSAHFKLGVEAGLNSAVDSNNWQAGNELGQELKNEVANKEPVWVIVQKAKRETLKMRRMKRKNSSLPVLAVSDSLPGPF